MKITRNDILSISKKTYELGTQNEVDGVSYIKWLNFIENHKNYFIWYEDTPGGKEAMASIDKVPDWAKERVLYSLNKRRACATMELANNPTDFVVVYSESDCRISISLEKNLNRKAAQILLSMAHHLDALLLKDGSYVIDEKVIEKL